MRFDLQKSFPYPVLRPGVDDYVDGEFQVTVDFSRDQESDDLIAEISVALSVGEIEQQIRLGNAAFSVLFSCRDTYFREIVQTDSKHARYTFAGGALRGQVVVSPFVVATKPIPEFSCDLINPEFNASSFSFSEGELLAADEPKVIYIDRDLFRPISSIMQIVKADHLSGFEWRASFDTDKIQIQLSAEAKEVVDQARNSKTNKVILINSIYFATLMQAVQFLKDDRVEFAERRWAHVINHQCHNLGINLESHDSYVVAQSLLKTPFKLINAYCFKDDE